MNEYKLVGHHSHKYLQVKFVSPYQMKGLIPGEGFFFVHKQATWGDSKSRDLKNHTRGVAEEVLVMMK